MLYNKKVTEIEASEREKSVYHSDVFAMIGTLFLFCFWPSFNAGVAASGDTRLRAVVNTYISIASSVLLTYACSCLFSKEKKLDMVHIQNATLAGGVAVGAVSDKDIGLFGAMIIGSVAGLISTLGYKYLLELLKKVHIHDTCGVHNLHGMPGVLSGLASIALAGIPARSFFHENLSEKCLSGGVDRTYSAQAGYQCAGLVLTLGMAIVGGLLTGLFLRLPIFATPDNDSYFDDSLNWHVPKDFVAEDSALGALIKNILPTQMSIHPRENTNTIELEENFSSKNSVHSLANQPAVLQLHHEASPALYVDRL